MKCPCCLKDLSITHQERISLIELLSKEEFIEKCKTDQEFSDKWGLKIEERELSLEERLALVKNNVMSFDELSKATYDDFFKKNNIPTKLITITYNNKTIENYE
jgi:hypothetical protein